MFGKKKTYGLKKEPVTRKSLDTEYNNNGLLAGHKALMVKEIQKEIEDHQKRMTEIRALVQQLPLETTPETTPEVTPDGAA